MSHLLLQFQLQQFNEARSDAHDLIYKSLADVLKAKVIESAGDSKKMWNTAQQLLHSTHSERWRLLRCWSHSVSSSPIRLLASNRKSLKSLNNEPEPVPDAKAINRLSIRRLPGCFISWCVKSVELIAEQVFASRHTSDIVAEIVCRRFRSTDCPSH